MSSLNTKKGLPASPLLNAQPPKARSTINLNKLEKSKFSHEDTNPTPSKDTNSLRIIIYVIIVIAFGVGAALLARQLINSNSTVVEEDNLAEEDMDTNPVSYVATYLIDTQVKSDSTATNIPSNEDFKTASLLTLGTSNVTNLQLNRIEYTPYQTFVRTKFEFSSTENRIPKTNINYDSAKDTLTLEFVGLTEIASELKTNKNIGGLVNSLSFDSTTNKFTLNFKQGTVYKVFAIQGTLYVDLRTEDEYTRQANATNNTTTETTDDSSSDTTNNTSNNQTTDTNKPAAPHYENDFSQNTQYVSSSVSTKSIALNNYYAWDEGSFFEFSWAEEDKIGDDYVPNAKAYLAEESGKVYLYVEIENLTRATLPGGITSEEIQTKAGVNMSNANFVALTLSEFDQTTGKAIYKIELKKKANFQLLTQESYYKDTQILSVQIKD